MKIGNEKLKMVPRKRKKSERLETAEVGQND